MHVSLSPPRFSSTTMTNGQFGLFGLETQLDKIYEINVFMPKLNTLVEEGYFPSSTRQSS